MEEGRDYKNVFILLLINTLKDNNNNNNNNTLFLKGVKFSNFFVYIRGIIQNKSLSILNHMYMINDTWNQFHQIKTSQSL